MSDTNTRVKERINFCIKEMTAAEAIEYTGWLDLDEPIYVHTNADQEEVARIAANLYYGVTIAMIDATHLN